MVSYLIPPDSLPRWIRWIFPAQRSFEDPYGRYDAAGPVPDARIDFLGRIPLTRPSSPSQTTECSSESTSISSIGNESELQPQPFLLGVPLEIKQQIWKDILGGFAFHLKLERRRLRSWVCLSLDPSTCKSERARDCGGLEKWHMISLLLTCRQIYSEAIEYLYSANAFIVAEANVMEYLPLILLPQRINSIHNLRFIWSHYTPGPPIGPYNDDPAEKQEVDTRRQIRWNTIWHNLSKMQNLRKLHVKLDVLHLFWQSINAESVRVLLEPIRDVTGPEEFILVLPFRAMDQRKPVFEYRWSAVDGWQGVDPWERLPCTIQRVSRPLDR